MRLSVCAALAIVLSPLTSFADDLSYQFETSVASSYVYRGIVQYAERDVPSSQSTAAVTLDHVAGGTVSIVAWNATAMSDYGRQPGNALEFDLSAGYTRRVGDTAITAGYMAYLFPDHMAGTPIDAAHELSLVVAHDTPYVTPFAGVYGEFVRQQGAYLTAGAGHDFKLGAFTVTPTASVGAAAYRKYLGSEQSASPHLNDVTAACAGKLDLGHGMYALARLSYAVRLTPSDLVPDMDWGMQGMQGRQSLFGAISLGVAR
ncbi:MAG TPA: TorF family putative porin [Kofleriaceae bacterium]|nr:TorF family putative porin [Kofleriaceae bacterium]